MLEKGHSDSSGKCDIKTLYNIEDYSYYDFIVTFHLPKHPIFAYWSRLEADRKLSVGFAHSHRLDYKFCTVE